jgi:hypothetical protein
MIRLLLAALTLASASVSLAKDTTIYINARIYTASDDLPTADAMAVSDGKILAIGNRRDVMRHMHEGAAQIDMQGLTILPGLIDAHAHMSGLGALDAGVIDLSTTTSYDEVIELVRARAASVPRGTWILGRGWDHESWASKELPTHNRLSDAVPDHPVWLSRVDGHAGMANTAAMQAAGVSSTTDSPEGGDILRGAGDEPTGVFIDRSMSLIGQAIPRDATASPEKLILLAQERCLKVGLVGVHDMRIGHDEIAAYERLEADGRLRLRVYGVIRGALAEEYFEANPIRVSDRFTLRACKLYMDGAMGSRGAWLLEPYLDRPTDDDGEPYTGLSVTDPLTIDRISKHAVKHGYQVCTHAIGDAANRRTLDAYEYAHATAIPNTQPGVDPAHPGLLHERGTRFRIEHAQLVHPDDIPRFEALGVLPSMQPTHCTSDMRWFEDRVGAKRLKGAYAWRSLIDSGVPIPGGSDFPVESENPLYGFYSAITRQNHRGEPVGGWLPGQRMTRTEALKSMTIWAAYASFEEDWRGSLEPGKVADFVVLDHDIMTCKPGEILITEVVRTVIGGETVYERE